MTMYVATFAGVAVTAQQDLFEIVAPASGLVVVHRIEVSQTSEVGDVQEEGLQLLVRRGQTTSGSGGTLLTAVDMGIAATTFAGTVEANNTTKASTGTIVTLHSGGWNVRTVFEWVPAPECRILLAPAQRATVELGTTPADSVTMSGTLLFELI